VEIGEEAVPYHGGNFIGPHCHTISARSHAMVRILRPLVPAEWATAYERGWVLLWGVKSTLNHAAENPANVQRRFKADARAFVSLIQESCFERKSFVSAIAGRGRLVEMKQP